MSRNRPFSSADAWQGPHIRDDESWIYRFSAEDIRELHAALQHAEATAKPLKSWTMQDFPLPQLARRIALWLGQLNEGRGFMLIRGFPVFEYSKEQCAGIYWGMGLHMGVAVSQNSDGDLLTDVRDTGVAPEAGVRLYKTRAEQDFHVDGADIVGLFCLRAGRSGGLSRIVSSVAIFNRILALRPDLVPVLFATFPFDNHGQERPGENPWFDFPICHESGERLRTFFLPWYIRDSQRFGNAPRLTQAQLECVEMIETLANDTAFYLDMQFEPGDMQLLKNASILHKRTAYEDWDEPDAKRHLLRLWLSASHFSGGDAQLRRGISVNQQEQL